VQFDFINLDDPEYVIANTALRNFDAQFIEEAFTTSYMGWWMPLTWITLALDYQMWGLNPTGYHLSNILLHALTAGVVVHVAAFIAQEVARSTFHPERNAHTLDASRAEPVSSLYAPILAGILWGLHPLRVESVAWVTERKDVLCGLFSVIAMLSYLRYTLDCKSRRTATVLNSHYWLAVVFFALAVCTKPVGVVLPVVFLVLDWYPLHRFTGDWHQILREKIPFLVISIAVAVATVSFATHETILVSLADLPLSTRLIIAGYSLTEYVSMSLVPIHLHHLYLLPKTLSLIHYAYAATSIVLTIIFFIVRKRWPWLIAAWILFIIPILPVSGVLQNGSQSHADRFTYLPAVMPSTFIAVALMGLYPWLKKNVPRIAKGYPLVLLTVITLLYGGMTYNQLAAWQDSATLWSRLIELQPIGRAYVYRGDYYLQQGDYVRAAADFQVAVEYARSTGNPDLVNLYALLGDTLRRAARYHEAVAAFSSAIALQPVANFYYHRGTVQRLLGKEDAARADFAMAGTDTAPIKWLPTK
jgi:hypothetical protein